MELLPRELLQRCRSRVRTTLAIDVIRLGLHRDLRTIRQNLSNATPRSTGARAAADASLRVLSVGVSSCRGLRLIAGGQPGAGALVGEIGQDGDALPLPDADDLVSAGGGQVVGSARCVSPRRSAQPIAYRHGIPNSNLFGTEVVTLCRSGAYWVRPRLRSRSEPTPQAPPWTAPLGPVVPVAEQHEHRPGRLEDTGRHGRSASHRSRT